MFDRDIAWFQSLFDRKVLWKPVKKSLITSVYLGFNPCLIGRCFGRLPQNVEVEEKGVFQSLFDRKVLWKKAVRNGEIIITTFQSLFDRKVLWKLLFALCRLLLSYSFNPCLIGRCFGSILFLETFGMY